MASERSENRAEKRKFERTVLAVSFRLVPKERPGDAIDGETIDVSANGLGVKIVRDAVGKVDRLLEELVEDRVTVEVLLRLPEGSVAAEGYLMWWALLGENEGCAIRAGVLLRSGWSAQDWKLISKSLA